LKKPLLLAGGQEEVNAHAYLLARLRIITSPCVRFVYWSNLGNGWLQVKGPINGKTTVILRGAKFWINGLMPSALRCLKSIGRKTAVFIRRSSKREDVRKSLQRMRPVISPYPLMRVGSDNDGGYLIPNDLSGLDVCFSPGVADVCDFERELAKRGFRTYMADFSVGGPPEANSMFEFDKLFIGSESDGKKYITLDDWIRSKAITRPFSEAILQMDIEGAEYGALRGVSCESLRLFRVIVLELHDLDLLLRDEHSLTLFNYFLDKILADFEIVHFHANNFARLHKFKGLVFPEVVEISLLRKDRFTGKERAGFATLPHPLDAPNDASRPEITLKSVW
jgi:hypothetical protein